MGGLPGVPPLPGSQTAPLTRCGTTSHPQEPAHPPLYPNEEDKSLRPRQGRPVTQEKKAQFGGRVGKQGLDKSDGSGPTLSPSPFLPSPSGSAPGVVLCILLRVLEPVGHRSDPQSPL